MRSIFFLFVLLACFVSFKAWSTSANRILVDKSDARIYLYKNDKLIADFHVVFGFEPVGHKTQEGDGKTPEGHYTIDFKKKDSDFFRALHISYPNAEDIKQAEARGVSPGGDIMIHGQKNGYGWAASMTQMFNWTLGCIALTDEDMLRVWNLVDSGTPIEIRP